MLCFWPVVLKYKISVSVVSQPVDLQTEYFLIYMVDLFEAQYKTEWNDDF